MRKMLKAETFSKEMRKIALYYLGYCALLILIQVSLVSVVAFFHFLLDHEMAVVESWLTRNAWEILSLSKIIALFVVLSILRLNLYTEAGFLNFLKKLDFKAEFQVIIFVLFMLSADSMLLINGAKSYSLREIEFVPTLTTFFGSAIFYLVDLILVVYLMDLFSILKKRNKVILLTFFIIVFLFVTSVIHPYSSVNSLYMILFYLTLVLTFFIHPRNFGNLIWLSTSYIGLSSIIFGQDLVWANTYSLITQPNILPPTAHLLCWLLGVTYLVKSVRLNSLSSVS